MDRQAEEGSIQKWIASAFGRYLPHSDLTQEECEKICDDDCFGGIVPDPTFSKKEINLTEYRRPAVKEKQHGGPEDRV